MAVAASRSRSLRPSGPELRCRLAATDAELESHYAIRHAVFVAEQRIFTPTDRDERDAGGALHIVGLVGDELAGTVRIYPLDGAGLWKGDRLAVLKPFRHHGLGAPLVRCAVETAGLRGGRAMVAFIQPQNVDFFERLGWRRSGRLVEYAGLPHQRMETPLAGLSEGR
jgi:putative N-acetyltransferase (TIGR04045 family)